MLNPSRPAAAAARSRRTAALKIALCLAGILLALLLAELGARIVSGNWTGSFLEASVPLIKTGYPMDFDPVLGWVPRPGFSSDRNVWNSQVTITAAGLRANGPGDPPRGGRPILAVGDSFTFGDEVADGQTWPAQLERVLGRPVLNAGVSGYGLDQVVLRARALAAAVRPGWVIVSFIPSDISRCELSVFGAAKPYFALENGELRLANQPVPPPTPVGRDRLRRILGHSFLVHIAMSKIARGYWLAGRPHTVRAHGDGEKVAARLLRGLAEDLAAAGVRLLVVAQAARDLDQGETALATRVLTSLGGTPAATLDLQGPLAALRSQDPARFAELYRQHMTEAGNAFVADRIAQAIRRIGPPQ